MTKRRRCQIWVDPNFRKLLKQKAVEREKSVLDLTKELSFDDLLPDKKSQQFGIRFRRIL